MRFLVVYILLYNQVNANIYSEFPWHTVEKALTALCPSVEICGRSMEGNITNRIPCCSSCSCEESCESLGECCLVDRGDESYGTCIYPRSKYHNVTIEDKEDTLAYVLINKPPIHGCLLNINKSCRGEDLSKLMPVSDVKTGIVYFDEDCAVCHGVLETKPWVPVFDCINIIRLHRVDMSYELEKYFKDPASSPCYVTYIPNPELSLKSTPNPCHLHMNVEGVGLFEVWREVDIAAELNMTLGEIKDACYSNIMMPYLSATTGRTFVNPFCYMYDEGTIQVSCGLDDRLTPLRSIKYGALLDYGKVKRFMVQNEPTQRTVDMVCTQEKGTFAELKNEERCRPAHCPTGHLQDETGQCVLMTNNVILSGRLLLAVNIRLTPVIGADSFLVDEDQNITMDCVRDSLPWPSSWLVAYVGYIPVTRSNQTDEGRELVVLVMIENEILENILYNITSYLEGPVVIKIGNNTITFKQSLHDQNLQTSRMYVATLRPGSNIHSRALNKIHSWIGVDMMRFLLNVKKVITITKLYFCKQVGLRPHEFELIQGDSVLYYKVRDSYMFELQFRLMRDDIGEVVGARVCAEDAGFVPLVVNSSSSTSTTMIVLLVAVISMLM